MGEIKKNQAEINDMLEREDLKWKQRVKVHWLQNGDRNTKFFHMYASQRKKANRICEITNADGVRCASPTDISSAFLEYYQSLFSSSGPIRVDACLKVLEERVTPKMNAQLASDFTKDKIHTVISQMAPYKSQGSDGFASCFFQKYWLMIVEEVFQAILFCFNSGRSLETINYTNIVLIHTNN
jgi:hypothetical protein